MRAAYVGRFAPSPTGALHAGSLVAALASWLDARAHGGRWLVRIEDVDRPRCVAFAAETILAQLAACGLHPDEPPVWQSRREAFYEQAAMHLLASGWAYPCGCSRKAVDTAERASGIARTRGADRVYPGTCRNGLKGKPARALRVWTTAELTEPWVPRVVDWQDRRLGAQQQDVGATVGDFVLKRADAFWAYQLAVVVDDAAQGVTDVVRGEDLADNTARQIHLQGLLRLPTPRYLHTPLVMGPDGNKLSKQNGAMPLDLREPLAQIEMAGAVLGIRVAASDLPGWLAAATHVWQRNVS